VPQDARSPADVDDALSATIQGCIDAHRRLDETLQSVDHDTVRRPSRLPDWTIAHVLTHIARNAESYVRMLDAAGRGVSVEQYPGGLDQRASDIDAGSRRPAYELVDDVRTTTTELEATWARMSPEAWRGHGLTLGAEWPCRVLPFHRWREVELHHVDLGLDYTPDDWPDAYVQRELQVALDTLPQRLSGGDARALLAWLVGRRERPDQNVVGPWQREHYHAFPRFLEAVDPRAVTIFRSRLRGEANDEYQPTAQRMEQLARAMPGFVELKTFVAEDGEHVSLVTFASAEDHARWRAHPEHREAQRRGRSDFYDGYFIQVCRVISERSFRRVDGAVTHGGSDR